MQNKFILSILFIASSFSLFAQTYITNVTIADVEMQKFISNQTVVITKGFIASIQASNKIKILENATVIDGTGKYLFPGLTDAHIHFFRVEDCILVLMRLI